MSKDTIGVHGYKVVTGKGRTKPKPRGLHVGMPKSTVVREIEITDIRVRTCYGRLEILAYSGGMWVPICDASLAALPFDSVITARDIYLKREAMVPKIGKR